MTKIHEIQLVNFARFAKKLQRRIVHVTFPQEFSTILIRGKNGYGKSTLLDELNLLPYTGISQDIIEGEIGEKQVKFSIDGKMYRVTYIFKPTKESHSCSADLCVIENGKMRQLSQSSSVKEVLGIIKELTGLDRNTIKLSTITSSDIGIANMSSATRREYIQSILPIGDTKELSKTIYEKHNYFKKSKEANELKLADMPSSHSMENDKQNLLFKRNELNNKLLKISQDDFMEDTSYKALKEDIIEITNDIGLMEDILDIYKEKDMLISISKHNSNIESKISKLDGQILSINDRIVEEKNKLSNMKIESNTSISDLKNILDNHDYHNIDKDNVITDSFQLYVFEDNFKKFATLLSELIDRLPAGYSITDLIKKPIDASSLFKAKIRNLENKIGAVTSEKEKNYVDKDIVLEPSSDCQIPNCSLRVEYERISDKIKKWDELETELRKLRKDLNTLNDEYEVSLTLEYCKSELNTLLKIVSENKNFVYINKEAFSSGEQSFKHYLSALKPLNFDNRVIDIVQRSNVVINYNKIKSDYETKKISDVETINKTIEELYVKLDVLNAESDKLKEEIIHTNKKYQHLFPTELEKEFKKYSSELQKKKIQINEEDKKREIRDNNMDTIKKIESEVERINSELRSLENNIFLQAHLSSELEKNIIDLEDSTKIKESLTKNLPVKAIRRLMLTLKDVANEFLERTDSDFRIKDFKVTAKDFIVEIQNESFDNDDMKNMSSGERSMVGLATTFALNTVMLPKYGIFNMDETDATLDADNKKRYLDIIDSFSEMKDAQIIVVSHNEFYNSSNSEKIGVLELKKEGDLEIVPFDEYVI